ncbi:MAG TPA: FABP family protein [Anaerolineales bacterium]|nr:FABP family protein [Anaerolineales bacterium]
MGDKSATIHVLDLLQGTWTGDGRGQFPGVTSFAFREMLVFTRRDEKNLAYEQRTQKLYDGQTEYVPSHWESGFLSLLENGDLQLVNIQVGGRNEVLIGTVESNDDKFRIHFVSKVLNNDPRMVSSARTFELEGDTLRYEMGMQTTKVNQSTLHLRIALKRIR